MTDWSDDYDAVYVSSDSLSNIEANFAKISVNTDVSWTDADKYCKVYNYIGLATIITLELDNEAQSICSNNNNCWIGAYRQQFGSGWDAHSDPDFIYSHWNDTDYEIKYNQYEYLNGNDGKWTVVDSQTNPKKHFDILCDITTKSTSLNDAFSELKCNDLSSQSLWTAMYSMDESFLSKLQKTVSPSSSEVKAIQEHIVCTESVFAILTTMNPLSTVIKSIQMFTEQINIIMNAVEEHK